MYYSPHKEEITETHCTIFHPTISRLKLGVATIVHIFKSRKLKEGNSRGYSSLKPGNQKVPISMHYIQVVHKNSAANSCRCIKLASFPGPARVRRLQYEIRAEGLGSFITCDVCHSDVTAISLRINDVIGRGVRHERNLVHCRGRNPI